MRVRLLLRRLGGLEAARSEAQGGRARECAPGEGEEAGGAGVASPGKEEDPYKVLVEVLREKCEQELSASAAGRGEGKENEGKDDCTGDEKTREEGGDETETEKGSGAAGGGKGESILGRAADHYVGMGGRVEVSFDVAMRSPKNGMITLLKT